MLVGGCDFDFIEEPPDDLLCLICLFPAKEPMQLNCCGKIYCKTCLSEYNRKSKKGCPNCRNAHSTSFYDMRSRFGVKITHWV